MALGRRHGRAPEGLALAIFIALGIGLHNFGEGLVVGAAIAAGEAALATFLVVGFTIHNVSEGFGIATPLIGRRPSLAAFAGLAALAGLPAVVGVWLGAQAVSPFWMALCFGIGAGAILQVIIEVTALIVAPRRARGARDRAEPRRDRRGFGGDVRDRALRLSHNKLRRYQQISAAPERSGRAGDGLRRHLAGRAEKPVDLLRLQRPREQKTLQLVAADGLQEVALRRRFHALRGDVDAAWRGQGPPWPARWRRRPCPYRGSARRSGRS